MNKLSSLSLLGLDPSAFRLVHEDETKEGYDCGAIAHKDGTECQCHYECREWLEENYFPALDAHRFPH